MCSFENSSITARVFIFSGPAVIIDHLAIFTVPKQEMLVYKVNLFNIFDIIDLFVSAYFPYFQKKDTKHSGTKPSVISSLQLFLRLVQAAHFETSFTISRLTRRRSFPPVFPRGDGTATHKLLTRCNVFPTLQKFPSYLMPRYQNETSCQNLSYENEFDLHEIETVGRIHFSMDGFVR